MIDDRPGAPPFWSAAGFAQGVRLAAPAMPVMALFGVAFGAFAAQKDVTLTEAALMSAFMFAGASQFVAAEIWAHPMTVAGVVALVAAAAAVMVLRRNEFLAVAAGVAVAILARSGGV